MVYVPTSFSTPKGPVITDDRECPNCKYNLKGLREGQACPECGFASGRAVGDDETSSIGGFWGKVLSLLESGHTPGIGSSLTEAPRSYLHQLSFACRIMQAALVLCLAFPAAALLAIKLGADRSSIFLALSMSFLMPACLWAWGTWVMSAPRRTRELASNSSKEWSSTRKAIRSTQIFWMVGAAVFSVRAWASASNLALPGPEWAWLVALLVPLTVAFIGLTWVTLYAARIAEWANDIDMADRLRLASLGVLFAPPIILLAVGVTFTFDVALMQFFAAAMGVLASLLPLAWLIQLIFATMQFISMAKWAQVNADTIAERDERMVAKAQQNYAKANRVKEAAEPLPFAPTLNRAHVQAKPQVARPAAAPQKTAAATQKETDTFELAPPAPPAKSTPRVVRHDKAP
ncbi:MAG: hypothetical protein U0640_13165 [Phycisphaerales bacterium]